MEWPDIKMTLQLGTAIVATISIAGLTITYRGQLKQLLEKAAFTIRFRLGMIDIEVKRLQPVQQQMENAGILPPSIGSAGAAQRPKTERVALSGRDAVLESWSSLKQVVYDAAVGRRISLTQATKTPEAVERLVSAKAVTRDLAKAVIVLYEEGKRVADFHGKMVDKEYAVVYQELADRLIDWMICNVIPPQEIPKPQRRPTSVGGYFYFPLPGPGQPTAILVGVRGPVQGRQFSVEKELFRIGATPENDLVIVGDDYVSGKHAYLRYEKGSLWLTDQHSRNGTFLNDNQVTDRALTLKPGDRIRVGNSTLEVVQAPGR